MDAKDSIDNKQIMDGIMGTVGVMMNNLHKIAERNCECAELAKEVLVAMGDPKYKQIGTPSG